jgi:hypothetical protein
MRLKGSLFDGPIDIDGKVYNFRPVYAGRGPLRKRISRSKRSSNRRPDRPPKCGHVRSAVSSDGALDKF